MGHPRLGLRRPLAVALGRAMDPTVTLHSDNKTSLLLDDGLCRRVSGARTSSAGTDIWCTDISNSGSETIGARADERRIGSSEDRLARCDPRLPVQVVCRPRLLDLYVVNVRGSCGVRGPRDREV